MKKGFKLTRISKFSIEAKLFNELDSKMNVIIYYME